MMYAGLKINREQLERLKAHADFRDFIPGLHGMAATKYATCPFCGRSGRSKGLAVSKKYAKCFVCGGYFRDVIDAIMHYDRVDFITAVKILAQRQRIYLFP